MPQTRSVRAFGGEPVERTVPQTDVLVDQPGLVPVVGEDSARH